MKVVLQCHSVVVAASHTEQDCRSSATIVSGGKLEATGTIVLL